MAASLAKRRLKLKDAGIKGLGTRRVKEMDEVKQKLKGEEEKMKNFEEAAKDNEDMKKSFYLIKRQYDELIKSLDGVDNGV